MSRELKDSGIPWIGEIPKDWVVRKLRNLGRFSASGIDKKIVEGEPLMHIINYVDVYKNPNKELRAQEYMLVSAPIEKCSEHQVNVGDMIFTPSSETIEDIGVSAVIMDELPNTAFSYHVLRFQPNNVVDLKYRKYFTNNNYCLNYFSSCATGTIRKTISRDVFKECLVVLPSLVEQQRIAEFLDRKCAEVDEMIALQEQIIEELKAYKQSVITEAVTKGLNPAAPMRDSGIEWFPLIPANWEIRLLKRLCANITDGSHFSPNTTDEGKPYITVSDVYNDTIHYGTAARISNDDFEALVNNGCQPPVGAVLLAKDGTVGRTAIVENNNFVVLSSLGILTPNEFIISTFLKYLLDSNPLQEQMKLAMAGSALKRITITKICKLIGVIPSNQEQKEITDYLDTKCTEIDNLISIKQSKIDSLKEYKKSIIYEYVTGKMEVK